MTRIRVRVLPALIPIDGKQVEMQVSATHIQWRYVTDVTGEYEWENLIAIADLIGADGPAIELQSNGTYIQYRVVGDVSWINIVPLTDLTGPQGATGLQGATGATGATGAAGVVQSVVAGNGVTVNATDPANPIVTATASVGPGLGLAAAVGSSALTISLKGANGSDPAAGNPVNIAFRNVTLATGTPSIVTATSALSLVISSGSTMGFTSATAGRLWIVIFNDAGTLRLGAINCRNGTDIYPLGGTKIASSTAEGGAGAADSAHVIYTGTAVTSKAYVVLGFMDWASGLTTAGTWAIVPTTIKLYDLGDKLPGDVIQSVSSTTQTNATVASTTFADTNSTVTMTPTAAPNVVAVFANGALGIVAASTDKRSQARLSRGGTQIGIGVQNEVAFAGTVILPAAIAAMDAPGTVSACTWKVQINCTDASQTGLWGHPGLGSVTGAYISATEIMG